MRKLTQHVYRSLKEKRTTSASKSEELFSLLPNGLTLLDIGAAGGIEPRWKKVGKNLNYIGIEPDERSTKELKKLSKARKTFILNKFAWDKETRIEFNLCREPKVSSSYIPNRKFLDKFPDSARFDIIKREVLSAEPLENTLTSHTIDFVKLDIQGGELKAMEGLGDKLKECLGVEIEIEFSEIYTAQPLFGEVDSFLRSQGFYFSDFTNLTRWEKRSHEGFGRCVFGDGLWLRNLESIDHIKDEWCMKYAAICSLYGKLDEANTTIDLAEDAVNKEEFKRILQSQTRMQRRERKKFNIIRRLWSIYSPSSNLHLME